MENSTSVPESPQNAPRCVLCGVNLYHYRKTRVGNYCSPICREVSEALRALEEKFIDREVA